MQLLDLSFRNNARVIRITEGPRQQWHLWTWTKMKAGDNSWFIRWEVYLLQLLLPHHVCQSPPWPPASSLPGSYRLDGGITRAVPRRPLQCTSASTPPPRTYQSPPLPPKGPPPPGSSSLGGRNTRTGPGRPSSQCTGSQPFETLDHNAIDEPEKMEMKAKKLTKIKLMSLPAAASPFFQLLKLLLAVLRRYSFSLLHFSIVAADL